MRALFFAVLVLALVPSLQGFVGRAVRRSSTRAASLGAGGAAAPSLELGQVFEAARFLEIYSNEGGRDVFAGVYALEGEDEKVKFVGIADDVVDRVRQHFARRGPQQVRLVRVQTFAPQVEKSVLVAYRNELIKQTKPLGNLDENDWDMQLEMEKSAEVESPFASSSAAVMVGEGGQGAVQVLNIRPDAGVLLELTKPNVDKVLDEVRPYLIADGGNVAVVSIDEKTRSISLVLQGACGSCASSTTTMKMGIERVLHENFANLGPVISVDPQSSELLTVQMVEESLSKILPAIKGMGGSITVRSTDGSSGTVVLGYKGPAKLRQGIELVLKDIALIKNVVVEAL